MKLMSYDGAIEGVAVCASEYESPFLPPQSRGISLLSLAFSMLSKKFADRRWHHDCPSATGRLRLDEFKLAVKSLELAGDSDVAHSQVDVVPTQPECFTLAQAKGERDRIQSL
jgi:hypothetical protein